jgi:hypothetical protein
MAEKKPQLKCESAYTLRASNGESFAIPCERNFSHDGECRATLTWTKEKKQWQGK